MFSTVSMAFVCSLASIFDRTILLAVPALPSRHSFWAFRPPTILSSILQFLLATPLHFCQSMSTPVYFCCAQRSGKLGRQAVRCCHTRGILHLATLFLLIPRGDSHPRSYPTISKCHDVFRFAQGSAARPVRLLLALLACLTICNRFGVHQRRTASHLMRVPRAYLSAREPSMALP